MLLVLVLSRGGFQVRGTARAGVAQLLLPNGGSQSHSEGIWHAGLCFSERRARLIGDVGQSVILSQQAGVKVSRAAGFGRLRNWVFKLGYQPSLPGEGQPLLLMWPEAMGTYLHDGEVRKHVGSQLGGARDVCGRPPGSAQQPAVEIQDVAAAGPRVH